MSNVGADAQMRIPIGMNHGGGFGVDCALAQLIITWARAHAESVLHLYASSESVDEHVAQLARTTAGFAAMIMSSSFHSLSHDVIPRRQAVASMVPLVEAMYQGNLAATYGERGARPRAINLFSINHAKREFIHPFYYQQTNPVIQPRGWFTKLVENAASLMLSRSDLSREFLSALPALGDVLYELISNADEHAVTDVNGVKYKRGLRGVTFKTNMIKSADAGGYVKGEPEFSRFILSEIAGNSGYLKYFEISVLDSGPGLARRWLSAKEERPVDSLDSLDISQEFDATLNCFKKHITTKDQMLSGMGLHNTVQAFNKLGAFVKLRTGRLSLYQKFDGKQALVEFSPKAWAKEGQLAAAEGTAFTICIPVKSNV